jgi:hypothetical protein
MHFEKLQLLFRGFETDLKIGSFSETGALLTLNGSTQPPFNHLALQLVPEVEQQNFEEKWMKGETWIFWGKTIKEMKVLPKLQKCFI